MALIKWYDDSEDKDPNDLFGSTPVKSVASVQSGSWQPSPSGADSSVATDAPDPSQASGGIFGQEAARQANQAAQDASQPATEGNYLLSDEKAQVDQRKQQRDAEIEAARQQAAAQQAAQAAEEFRQGQVKNSQGQPLDVNAVKQDTGWKKYYDQELAKQKASLGFWGRLMDGGQASRLAEVNARNKYNADLIRQAYDAQGNVVDPNAATQAGKLTAYGTALANDNITRGKVAGNAIGATTDNQRTDFWNRIKNSVNAEKQMSIYDAIAGVDDKQKLGADDPLRFAANLLQGIPTMPTIGAKELYEAGSGRGTNSKTGLEDNLNAGERFGRGVSGVLNTVTPFVGGSGKLLDSLTTKVMTNTATAAETSLLKQLTSRLLMPALEQGGIGAAQSGAEYFGNGNSLLDKDGNFDKSKLLDFTKQVGTAGGMGVVGGLAMGGGAMGINRLRGRGWMPALPPGELADAEIPGTNAAEAQASSARAANAEGTSMRALENGEVTPVREPVADGVAQPDVPPVKEGATLPDQQNLIPARNPEITTTPDLTPVTDTPPVANPAETAPVVETPAKVPDVPAPTTTQLPAKKTTPADVTPVADSVVQSGEPIPVTDKNTPVIPAEQVRQLQESIPGKSQADEAVINQKLQQLEAQKPLKHFTTKEAADALRAGEPFDYNKDPVHGTGGKDFGDKTGRMVSDGKPAMYLSLDDKKWNTGLSPNPDAKVVDVSSMSLPEYEQFIKDGGTPSFNYKTQKQEGRMNAYTKTPLEGVDYHVKSDAKKLTIDSPEKLMEVAQSVGKHPDDPQFWGELRNKYDVVELKNVDKSSQVSEVGNKTAKRFFQAAKGDQAIVLNPDVVSTKPFESPKPASEKGTVAPKSTPENVTPVKETPQLTAKPELTPITDKSIPKVDSVPEGMKSETPAKAEVPTYKSPVKNSKTASVPGTSKARYATGDPNLDGIIHDSIIAHNNKSGTAGDRAQALDDVGIDSGQRKAIRDIAVKSVDRETGAISPEGKAQIEDVINGKKPEVSSAPVDSTPPAGSTPPSDTPPVDSTPEGMKAGDTAPVKETNPQHDLIDRVISTLDEPKEYINRVAEAITPKNGSPIKADDMRETLDMYGDKGNSALKDRIATKYERLKEITNEMNKPQLQNRKNLKEGGMALADTSITKNRSELQIERNQLEKSLGGDIKKLTAQTSGKARASMVYNNLKNYRKSNMLLGASNIERQAPQDIIGLLNDVVKNPKLMGKALSSFPKEYVKSIHNAARDWAIPPKTLSEIPKYVLGNAYESAMSLVGVEGAVRARTSAYRNVEARNVLSKLGYDVTKENIDAMSKMMGNEAELMAHTAAGVANFMTSNTQFKKASDAYNAYLDGNPLERTKFLDNVAKQSTVAAQIKQQLFKSDNPMAHIAAEVIDFVSPFVRTASNAFDTTFTQTLNPFSKTASDYILKSNRSTGRNILASAQNAAMDGAMIAGTVGLIGAGKIVYNNGDDVDKPNGLSIKVGDSHFIPIRATHVELAVATIYVATQVIKDVDSGNFKASNIKDYMGILDNSLPYVDSLANTNKAISSATSGDEGDNNYAAKAYGVSTAKSLVPGSNNGLQPYIAGRKGILPGVNGESMDAKSTYDKNPIKWLGNSLNNSYFRGDYLPVSRDAAGRARTSDSQGAFINKTINDVDTKEFNGRVNDLVTYGKQNGLGKSTQEMFNTYPTDKNNNFKSVQDAITFLDAPTMNGKATPDNSKKLEKNKKLAGLAQQERDGFFGDSGSDLLTLDGQNLKSDASVPNTSGSKNSHLPVSIQSIRNAVAQTDLSKDDSDKLYAISGQSTALYNQLKAKDITYAQYSAAKADLSKQESGILGNSKSYKKMQDLFNHLDGTGFFEAGGLGSTKSGQTYLWNSLNALLAAKGATPAAQYPDPAKSGFTPWGNGGTGRSATNKPGDRGNTGIKWTPVGKRQMANVASAKYTPVKISVKLGNEIKKDKTQNYASRSF